jgi:rhodanese-related sulfurtransferase
MAVNNNSEYGRILRNLYPLITFPSEAFKDLCADINVETVQDAAIFKRGDTNTDLVYLLEGSVTLQAEGLVVEVINSDSESAKFALAHQIPRKIDAVANGMVRIIRLDAHTVNNPPPAVFQEDLGYTVVEESSSEESDDWMSSLLRFPLFEDLPATNLQKILISLRTSQFTEGDVILENGSALENFYVVYKGQCLLTRDRSGGTSEVRLGVGDSFGEEYLITGLPVQETVIALTDVSIIQIEKNLFLNYIKKPALRYVNADDVEAVQKNGAIILDVRLPFHYENKHLPDSANIPLLALRMRLLEIPKDRQIIVVCANGQSSEAAAYFLTKHRFNAVVLKDGMGIEEFDENEKGGNQGGTPQPVQLNSHLETAAAENTAVNEGIKPDAQADYVNLLQRNRELEEINAKLQGEKEEAIKQCEVLTQQLERLKEITNRLAKIK